MSLESYLGDHVSDARRAAAERAEGRMAGLRTETPQALVEALLAQIQRQFYTTVPLKKWLQERGRVASVITWPAVWLRERGVGLPLDRYEAILREIIRGIQQHGATGEIEFFPAYFERAVKNWFLHNGDELYAAQKSIRNALDLRWLKTGRPVAAKGPDPIDAMVQAHRILTASKGRKRAKKTDESEPSLFDV